MFYNGLPITIHEITEEFGSLVAIVNKGEKRTPFVFKVPVEKIEGLVIA